nr:MAG TPA_asm: hypothetical protein [Bacteriophage sp.]
MLIQKRNRNLKKRPVSGLFTVLTFSKGCVLLLNSSSVVVY